MSRTIILIQSSADQMLTYLFLCTFLFCWSVQFCAASDTLATGASIKFNSNETLLSAGKIFELGFFSPDGRNTYVGIWYYMWEHRVIVWVANRDNPLHDPADSFFRIDERGNLVLLDKSENSYFSTGLWGRLNSSRSVKLWDTGNLVLTDDSSEKSQWQSFDHPTDTFLPGMNMYKNLTLISQTSDDDPRSGNFSLKPYEVDNRTFVIRKLKTNNIHWISGESNEFNSYTEMPKGVEAMLANFSNVIGGSPRSFVPSGNMTHISLPNNFTSSVSEYKYTRIVMSSSGEIQFWNMSSLKWSAPGDNCSVYNRCGNFESCNRKTSSPCKCFPGFKRSSPENSEDNSAGCARKSDTMKNDTFLSLKMMRVGQPASSIDSATNETSCREECLQNLKCTAYSYVETSINPQVRTSYVKPSSNPPVHNGTCWMWKTELSNLEEEYAGGGHDLYVRVAASDIGSTSRCCKPCGAYLIPYPLSTGSNCGDPLYSSFNCSNSTGQVSFKTLNSIYQVSSINPEKRTFVIQVKDACRNSEGNILQLNQSLPFLVTNLCYSGHSATPSSSLSLEVPDEVEITWNLPLEPLCTSSTECVEWPNSTCHAREDGKRRCLCNASHQWDGQNLNCTQGDGGSHKSLSKEIISMVVIIGVSLLCSISYFSYKRRFVSKRRENMQGSQSIRMYDTERRVKNLIDTGEFKEEDKKGIDVPFFDLESILEATDYFSDANKLGQGGFGPVYKGTFGGQEIAVKRLSSHSGQGFEEFKNEVVLIAKLQHRNLVRLQGYCIKGDEKILLYEYMRNKSLDAFIFDRTRCLLLDWEKRFDIIMGIARGLLYLHQDSRLRIIHRDLKTGNILLDDEMNPKISDFGLARIVGGKETEANTARVVGTYGYMSPEYALEGLFSVKSDVFSFGVIVLEIVSGKRNTGFYQSHQGMNLLSYAWRLWKEERALDLMDLTLLESCNRCEVLKCIIVGLLCVQEDPSHRPNMSNVVFMLGSETATLPNPKEPAFVARKWISTQPSTSSSKPDTCSAADITISAEGGR